nr:MAG TPA: hypothetical protein [Caudoviricetes sp.]
MISTSDEINRMLTTEYRERSSSFRLYGRRELYWLWGR